MNASVPWRPTGRKLYFCGKRVVAIFSLNTQSEKNARKCPENEMGCHSWQVPPACGHISCELCFRKGHESAHGFCSNYTASDTRAFRCTTPVEHLDVAFAFASTTRRTVRSFQRFMCESTLSTINYTRRKALKPSRQSMNIVTSTPSQDTAVHPRIPQPAQVQVVCECATCKAQRKKVSLCDTSYSSVDPCSLSLL